MSWFSSLFTGNSPQLNSSLSSTGSLSGFAQGTGQNNTLAGSNFFRSLLGGDSTTQAQALAPQINALKTSTNQDQKTAAQNSTRSGGTAASNAASSDKVHADITNLLGGLTGGAASSLLSSGSGLLGTALSGYGQQASIAEQQMNSWQQSLFGGALTGAAGIGLGAGAKKAGVGGMLGIFG